MRSCRVKSLLSASCSCRDHLSMSQLSTNKALFKRLSFRHEIWPTLMLAEILSTPAALDCNIPLLPQNIIAEPIINQKACHISRTALLCTVFTDLYEDGSICRAVAMSDPNPCANRYDPGLPLPRQLFSLDRLGPFRLWSQHRFSQIQHHLCDKTIASLCASLRSVREADCSHWAEEVAERHKPGRDRCRQDWESRGLGAGWSATDC